MERRARATFWVFKLNRWSLALALLIALALLLLPRAGFLPTWSSSLGNAKVPEGVTLYDEDFSGMTEPEARAVLAQMASRVKMTPVAAISGRESDGTMFVVPELNGVTLDMDLTWFRLQNAASGAHVEPATRISPPAKRLVDFPEAVLRQGNAAKQAVALLVNVDWGENELKQMLPVLKKRGVKVTFFVSGTWAEKNAPLLKTIAADGHEIATHGHKLSQGPKQLAAAGKLNADISQSVQKIESIAGVKVQYYAPHMSEVNPEIVKTAANLKLRTVLYSLDTVDWKDSTTKEMILATANKAKAGDFILMHPKPNTANVLDQFLGQLQSKGLHVLTLSEMVSPERQVAPISGQHE